MRRCQMAAIALLCFALSTLTFSQTSNATLGGTVSDATGALIPGVAITATNTGTGIVTNVLTNEAGAYQFASLQTGTYTVSAALPGFLFASSFVTSSPEPMFRSGRLVWLDAAYRARRVAAGMNRPR